MSGVDYRLDSLTDTIAAITNLQDVDVCMNTAVLERSDDTIELSDTMLRDEYRRRRCCSSVRFLQLVACKLGVALNFLDDGEHLIGLVISSLLFNAHDAPVIHHID